MPVCFACDLSCPTIGALFLHFNHAHSHLTSCECIENNCHRKFGSKKSFSRHFHLVHELTSKVDIHPVAETSFSGEIVSQSPEILNKPDMDKFQSS